MDFRLSLVFLTALYCSTTTGMFCLAFTFWIHKLYWLYIRVCDIMIVAGAHTMTIAWLHWKCNCIKIMAKVFPPPSCCSIPQHYQWQLNHYIQYIHCSGTTRKGWSRWSARSRRPGWNTRREGRHWSAGTTWSTRYKLFSLIKLATTSACNEVCCPLISFKYPHTVLLLH